MTSMDDRTTGPTPNETPFTLPELTAPQRRVLGTLIEKGLTTPEYYPLTLKALTTGCNQRNNREPLTNYAESDVEEVIDQLRELGVMAVVHTETGRTERFRHLLRHKLTITEQQLAILGELLLRGRQAIGELRSRASRMVAIDSLEQLRSELDGLIALGYVQASDDLDRRGVEIDHNLYPASEGRRMTASSVAAVPVVPSGSPSASTVGQADRGTQTVSGRAGGDTSVPKLEALEFAVSELRSQNAELRSQLEELRGELDRVVQEFADLRRALGG